MKFVTATPESTISAIAYSLNKALAAGPVLWLVSGGSNIGLAVKIREQLKLTHPLTVGLIDERFGPIGHADSNWTQLKAAEFDFTNVIQLPVMVDDKQDAVDCAKNYELRLIETTKTSFVSGLFGMGGDGHTSGILPHSSAVTAPELVHNYQESVYNRITTTPKAMSLFDNAFLVAFGESKQAQLRALHDELPIEEQPAQVLKQIENCVVLSDDIEETA